MASCSPALALERMEEIRQRSSGNEHNPASGGQYSLGGKEEEVPRLRRGW
jgi:hypothetical protein